MDRCLTVQSMFSDDSGCLLERPDCNFASRFGFSYVCRHPDHAKFRVHTTGLLPKKEALKLYKRLRQKRRDAFAASLEMTNWRRSSIRTDYFGQLLAEQVC